jgi:hypothetical protein
MSSLDQIAKEYDKALKRAARKNNPDKERKKNQEKILWDKKIWGGKREGAGRKPAPNRYKQIQISLTDEQIAWLDAQKVSRGETIRALIQAQMKKPAA